MSKTKDPFAATTSVFMVMELTQERAPAAPGISCVLSLPGREGTLRKRWKTVQGRLDEAQLLDLLGWVQLSAHNAVVSWTGTQGVLPME